MLRIVERIIPANVRQEGDGLPVRRGLPLADLSHVNPFLLLEEIGPVDLAAGGAVRTAPPRPARGYEEVTWMLDGSVTHRRPNGATVIAAPQASWVTVGEGDHLREEFAAGNTHGVRIWIALPRSQRRVERRILTAGAGVGSLRMSSAGGVAGEVQVQLLAGSLLAARAPIQPHTSVNLARVTMPADTTLITAVDSIEPGLEAPTVLLYGLAGHALVGHTARPAAGPHPARGLNEQRTRANELAVLRVPIAAPRMRYNEDEVRIRTEPGQTFDFLWLSGFPVGERANEAFVRNAALVQRTEAEILQAIEDFRSGRMGKF